MMRCVAVQLQTSANASQPQMITVRSTPSCQEVDIQRVSQWCGHMEPALAVVFAEGTPLSACVVDCRGEQRGVPLRRPPWETHIGDLTFPVTLQYTMLNGANGVSAEQGAHAPERALSQ